MESTATVGVAKCEEFTRPDNHRHRACPPPPTAPGATAGAEDTTATAARAPNPTSTNTQTVDEIEVYLAYQVKLRGPLKLPLDTADMRFFHVSYVKEEDLTAAKAQVQNAQREHFPDFLASQWQPWQSVLQRLQALGLQDSPDAQRQMGPQVTADIVREIKLPLTRDFLRERVLLSHLEPE